MYVGVTGGIGSGKSTLARLLGELGAHVIDADQVAREVVDDLAERIEARLGPGLVSAAGVDRARLADRVFADPQARRALEEMVHPEVAARVAALRAAFPSDSVVVYDVALLVEKGLADQFDVVVVVQAPLEIRLARLAERGISRSDALARMSTQATDEQRAVVADIVIDNSGALADLRHAAADLWHRLATYS